MATNELNTIDMTRHIRDALYEQIKDLTLAERLTFYRDKAQALHRQLGLRVSPTPPGEPGTVVATTVDTTDPHHRER